MHNDLEKELHRTCERATKELSELNDRLEQNKNIISPADVDIMFKLMDIIKDTKSTMKKIIEIEDLEQGYDKNYSGNYYSQPMWDRRYSGNSYHGQYTIATGDGRGDYSGRNMRRSYSRGDDTRMELEEMLNNTRDSQEAEVIRKILNKL